MRRQSADDMPRPDRDLGAEAGNQGLAERARRRMAEEQAEAEHAAREQVRTDRRNRKVGMYVALGVLVAVALGIVPLIMRAAAGEDLSNLFESFRMGAAPTIQPEDAETTLTVDLGQPVIGATYRLGDSFAWDSDGDGQGEAYRIVRVYGPDEQVSEPVGRGNGVAARIGEKPGFAIDMLGAVSANPQVARNEAVSENPPVADGDSSIIFTDGSGRHYVAGVVLVSVGEGVTAAQFNEFAGGLAHVEARDVSDEEIATGTFEMKVRDGSTIDDAIAELAASDLVANAQPKFTDSGVAAEASDTVLRSEQSEEGEQVADEQVADAPAEGEQAAGEQAQQAEPQMTMQAEYSNEGAAADAAATEAQAEGTQEGEQQPVAQAGVAQIAVRDASKAAQAAVEAAARKEESFQNLEGAPEEYAHVEKQTFEGIDTQITNGESGQAPETYDDQTASANAGGSGIVETLIPGAFFPGTDPYVTITGEDGRELSVVYTSLEEVDASQSPVTVMATVTIQDGEWVVGQINVWESFQNDETAPAEGEQAEGQQPEAATVSQDQQQQDGTQTLQTETSNATIKKQSPIVDETQLCPMNDGKNGRCLYLRYFHYGRPALVLRKGCGDIKVKLMSAYENKATDLITYEVKDAGDRYEIWFNPTDKGRKSVQNVALAEATIDVAANDAYEGLHRSCHIRIYKMPCYVALDGLKLAKGEDTTDYSSDTAKKYPMSVAGSQVGKTAQLKPSTVPIYDSMDEKPPLDGVAKPALTYSSTNTKVATVDKNGKITFKAPGSTKITVTSAMTEAYIKAAAEVQLTVNKMDPAYVVNGKTYTANTSMLKHVGNWHAILNVPTKYGNVTAKTSDKKIAEPEIKKNGSANDVILHCHKAGKMALTIDIAGNATYAKKSYKIDVTIKPKEKSYYSVNGKETNKDTSINDYAGKTVKACAAVSKYGTAKVSSSDKAVAEASMDKNGQVSVKLKKGGKATVTLSVAGTATYEKKDFKISINVKKNGSYYVVDGKNKTGNATVEKFADKTWGICDVPTKCGKATVTSADNKVAKGWIGDNHRLYIHIYKEGKTTVTLKIDGNDQYGALTAKFNVVGKKQHTKLTIATSQKGTVDGTAKITGKVVKGEASLKSQTTHDIAKWEPGLEFSSSNTKVATIDKNGKITFKGVGSVKFTVKAKGTNAYYASTATTASIPVKKSARLQEAFCPYAHPGKAYLESGFRHDGYETWVEKGTTYDHKLWCPSGSAFGIRYSLSAGKMTYTSSDISVLTPEKVSHDKQQGQLDFVAHKVGKSDITIKLAGSDQYWPLTTKATVVVEKMRPQLPYLKDVTIAKGKTTKLDCTATAQDGSAGDRPPEVYEIIDERVYGKPTGYAPKLTFSSNNTKVATVDKSGKVTAKSKGTAKITVKVEADRYVCATSKTITVTVK